MPPERSRMPDKKEESRRLYPNAFRYFEQLKEAAKQLGHRLEEANRVRDLTAGEMEALEAAVEQNDICEEMLEGLEADNLSYVIAHLERVIREQMGKRDLGPEATATVEKAGRALAELKQAQERILH